MTRPVPLFMFSNKQKQAMSDLIAREFVVRCRDFLRQNFIKLAESTNDELDRITRSSIDLGKELGFKKELSVQRLMALEQQFGFCATTKIPPEHLHAITVATDEQARLDHLEELLSHGRITS